MLKQIDRYIISKYLKTFLFTALIFTLIAVVIDFSEKVSKFIDRDCTWSQVFFEYYLNFIPWINSMLWPLFAMIAVIFFTSRLAKNSEIISILNAGVSFKRFLLPYIAGASILAFFLLLGNHVILPKGTKVLRDFENKYIWPGNDKTQTKNIHFFVSPNTKVFLRYFNRRDTSASYFRIEQFEDNQLKSILKARSLKWLGPPNRWQLSNYNIREIDVMNEEIEIGRGKKLDTLIAMTPDDFIRYSNQQDMMTSSELLKFIKNEKKRGAGTTKKYEAEFHRRTTDPFTIIILTIIGVAIASRKVRGGIGLHIAIGILLGAIFILMSKFALTFTTAESISAAFGMWIPNICFSLVALFLYFKAQK